MGSNLLSIGACGPCVPAGDTPADEHMAESSFAALPLDPVLGRASYLDLVAESKTVLIVVHIFEPQNPAPHLDVRRS